jgi:predicted anti-sigma-YlaC factor YlaD
MVSRIKRRFNREEKDPDCGKVRDLSSDYIDGDMDTGGADRMRGHLEWCGPCNAFVNTLRSTVNLLRATPKSRAPDDFREKIRERLKTETPSEG